MRERVGFLCLALLFMTNRQIMCEEQLAGTVERAATWLAGQQHPKTRLIRSFSGTLDKNAVTYDQAIAIIALSHAGRLKNAERCANAMLALRDADLRAWADAYDWATTEVTTPAYAAGPNGWMGMALVTLHRLTGETRYLAAAEEAAQFLQSLQDNSGGPADGSIKGGYIEIRRPDERAAKSDPDAVTVERRPFNWTSTEHCADAMALFSALHKLTGEEEYPTDAARILGWLNNQMWDRVAQNYRPGYSNNATREISQFSERLDSQTWTALAASASGMRIDINNGLPWIDSYRCRVEYKGQLLTGFPKVTLGVRATPSIWAEGTAGYVLAARRRNHKPDSIAELLDSLRKTQQQDGSVPYSIGVSCLDVTEHFTASDLVVCTFESHPNCLGGSVGVYGNSEPYWEAIESASFGVPYSWYYEPEKPGWKRENVHTGFQSFRLVNGTKMSRANNGWASLGIDLGPQEGKRTKPLDVRPLQFLEFWGKTENAAGARVKVLFRDSHTRSTMPQSEVAPDPPVIGGTWQRHRVELQRISRRVDLQKLVHVGLAFGKNVGNEEGTVIYVDDFAFIAPPGDQTQRFRKEMPAVMPLHWPYGSVAGTAWLIFAELDLNPFECR